MTIEEEFRAGKLTLANGLQLSLEEYRQFNSRAWLSPLRSGGGNMVANRDHERRFLEMAREMDPSTPAVLIPAARTYLELDLAEPIRLGLRAKDAATEVIPPICSMARLTNSEPTSREPDHFYSSLVVAWYQDVFGPPPEDGVGAQLRAIDWDTHAGNWTP